MKRLSPLVALLLAALCVAATADAKEYPKSKARLAREAKAAEKALKNLKVPEGWMVPKEDMEVGAKGEMLFYAELIEVVDDHNFIFLCKSFVALEKPGISNKGTSIELMKSLKLWVVDDTVKGRKLKEAYQRYQVADGKILLNGAYIVEPSRKAKTADGGEETIQCIRRYVKPKIQEPPLKDFRGPNSATAAK